MECFGTTDFDNNSRLITLSRIIINGLHCVCVCVYIYIYIYKTNLRLCTTREHNTLHPTQGFPQRNKNKRNNIFYYTILRFYLSYECYCCIMVKCTLVQPLKLYTGHMAHWGSRGIALLFHDQRH
jgi:hypothetical protein